jgi:hypothetical protein
VRSALASALAAVASAAVLAAPAAATGPDGCYVTETASGYQNCLWYADVNGEYGGAVAGGYWVYKYVGTGPPVTGAPLCSATVTTNCWSLLASGGAGPFASAPGTTPLTTGSYYSLVVQNGAGAEGSITGTGTL